MQHTNRIHSTMRRRVKTRSNASGSGRTTTASEPAIRSPHCRSLRNLDWRSLGGHPLRNDVSPAMKSHTFAAGHVRDQRSANVRRHRGPNNPPINAPNAGPLLDKPVVLRRPTLSVRKKTFSTTICTVHCSRGKPLDSHCVCVQCSFDTEKTVVYESGRTKARRRSKTRNPARS